MIVMLGSSLATDIPPSARLWNGWTLMSGAFFFVAENDFFKNNYLNMHLFR